MKNVRKRIQSFQDECACARAMRPVANQSVAGVRVTASADAGLQINLCLEYKGGGSSQ